MDGFLHSFGTPGALIMESQYFEVQNKFFDQWLKTCELPDHAGALIAAGPMRERTEKAMTGLPIFLNLYSIWLDSILDFQKLSFEAMNKMHEKITDIDFTINPENNKQLYNIFIEIYSDAFKDFLKTGHFARDMGKFMSGLIDLRKYNREMLEENFLNPLDVPTRTEVDELAREMYALRKKVRELTRKMEEQSS